MKKAPAEGGVLPSLAVGDQPAAGSLCMGFSVNQAPFPFYRTLVVPARMKGDSWMGEFGDPVKQSMKIRSEQNTSSILDSKQNRPVQSRIFHFSTFVVVFF